MVLVKGSSRGYGVNVFFCSYNPYFSTECVFKLVTFWSQASLFNLQPAAASL